MTQTGLRLYRPFFMAPFFMAWILISIVGLTALAQTASLSGAIKDANGATVAGARLIASGATSGGRQETTSDAQGAYRFEALKPGVYRLRIEARGFRAAVLNEVTVTASGATQDVTLETGALSEAVTITAQKIEEEIGQAAVAVNVLGGKQIEDAQITQLNYLHEYVPNFRVTNTGGRATYNFVTMRGFINPAVGVDPSAAIYIDGVPQSDLFSLNQALFDVERVEVVKGPQGTLYGVNALAGIVNITSRRPSGEAWHGGVNVSYGTYQSHNTDFNLAGPLIKNKLLFGFAGTVSGRDGFIRNVVTKRNYDDQFGYAGRARLIYNPSSRWDFALTLSGRKIDDKGGYIYLPTNLEVFNRLPTMTGFRIGRFEQALGTEGFNRANTPMGSFQATYYGEAVEVAYVGSRRKNVQQYFFDADLTPFPTFNGRFDQNYDEWYHEARVQSSKTAGGRFNWLLGVAANSLTRNGEAVISTVAGNPFQFPVADFSFGKARLTGKNVGVFGQGTTRFLSQRIGLTAGLRYDRATRDIDRKRGTPPFGTFPGLIASSDNDIVLPKFTVDARLNESEFVYFTVGRGWKTGGLAPDALAPAQTRYRAEKVWTYEGGVKTSRFGGKLYASAAVFWNDVTDFQDLIRAGIVSFLGNAEAVTMRGVEFEFNARPVGGFELSGSLGLIRTRYDKYLFDATTNTRFDGRRIPQVPNLDGSLIAQYRFKKGFYARGEMLATGNFKDFQYSVPTDPFGVPVPGGKPTIRDFFYPGYTIFNLGAGYETRRWNVGFFAQNVADKLYFTNSETGFGGLSGYTEPVGVVGGRRVLGVKTGLRF